MTDPNVFATLQRQFLAFDARLAALENATGLFASDKELDSAFGDPVLRFAPRAWKGDKFDGKHYSECPPELLDVLAEYLAWSAANPKPDKVKYVPYSLKDAARARGWARRKRSGWKAPAAASFDDESTGAPEAPDDGFGDAFEPPEGF